MIVFSILYHIISVSSCLGRVLWPSKKIRDGNPVSCSSRKNCIWGTSQLSYFIKQFAFFLSVCLSVCLRQTETITDSLFVCMSVFAYLSCLFVCLFVYLSNCTCFFLLLHISICVTSVRSLWLHLRIMLHSNLLPINYYRKNKINLHFAPSHLGQHLFCVFLFWERGWQIPILGGQQQQWIEWGK